MTGIGLCLPQLGPHVTAEAIREFCTRAEDLGYASLWVQDHFMWPLSPHRSYGGRPGAPIPLQYQSVLAPTELLTLAAAITTRVRLGTSVLVAGNHWPVSLAQRLATIDLVSGGRLLVGLGVGWNAEEHEASGTSIADRGRRMDDFISALMACWGDDPVAHDGPFFRIPPSIVRPKPLQRPRPLLLSGMWSPAGLERTRERFDAWNPAGQPVARVAATVAELDARRPTGMAPLRVFHRAFAQLPNQPAPTWDPVERLAAEAADARAAGFEEFILEHNFSADITSPEAWAAVPERYLPVLDAVR
jgi:probable F420-dependent oxidoreductase